MNKQESFLFGILAGAGIMYMLDPERGGRRRALVRDQIVHAGHELEGLGDAVNARARDLRNRATGMVREARARRDEGPIDDDVLVERVRAGMGRAVSNPGAIDVTARDGRVTLSGPVLAEEVDELVGRVGSVRGVSEVENRLDVREQPDDVSGLQGTERG